MRVKGKGRMPPHLHFRWAAPPAAGAAMGSHHHLEGTLVWVYFRPMRTCFLARVLRCTQGHCLVQYADATEQVLERRVASMVPAADVPPQPRGRAAERLRTCHTLARCLGGPPHGQDGREVCCEEVAETRAAFLASVAHVAPAGGLPEIPAPDASPAAVASGVVAGALPLTPVYAPLEERELTPSGGGVVAQGEGSVPAAEGAVPADSCSSADVGGARARAASTPRRALRAAVSPRLSTPAAPPRACRSARAQGARKLAQLLASGML